MDMPDISNERGISPLSILLFLLCIAEFLPKTLTFIVLY